jgi:hypothetical protein
VALHHSAKVDAPSGTALEPRAIEAGRNGRAACSRARGIRGRAARRDRASTARRRQTEEHIMFIGREAAQSPTALPREPLRPRRRARCRLAAQQAAGAYGIAQGGDRGQQRTAALATCLRPVTRCSE